MKEQVDGLKWDVASKEMAELESPWVVVPTERRK